MKYLIAYNPNRIILIVFHNDIKITPSMILLSIIVNIYFHRCILEICLLCSLNLYLLQPGLDQRHFSSQVVISRYTAKWSRIGYYVLSQ